MTTPENNNTPAHAALARIQTKLRARKDKTNAFGGYSYRNKEGIFEAVKPLLAEENAVITIADELQAIGNRYYIKATATFALGADTISATAYAREQETKKGMDEAQITGAASSYAGKYALCNLLAIDDSANDPDATNDHGKRLPTLEEIRDILAADSPEQLRQLYKAYSRKGIASGYVETLCKERVKELNA